MSSKFKMTRKNAILRVERIKAALSEPMTSRQIAEAVHLSPSMARMYCAMLSEQRQIHIDHWEYGARGNRSASYALGDLPNAAKPETLTTRKWEQRHREKVATDPERNERYLAQQRTASRVRRMLAKPAVHPWLKLLAA